MKWRPISEKPATDHPVSVLVATRDDEGEWFLRGIYLWRGGELIDEDEMQPLLQREGAAFRWAYESEVLTDLQGLLE